MKSIRPCALLVQSLAVIILIVSFPFISKANCPNTPFESGVAAAPSRPNFANTADILQEGVVEFEYGYSHSWVTEGNSQSDLPGLIRFAPFCDLEIRLGNDNLMQMQHPGQTERGLGDSWLTTQYEFWRQTKNTPALAISYGLKIPNADLGKGLGTGEFDHSFTFQTNKNFGKTTVTFNSSFNLAGRIAAPGFDRNEFFAGNFARPVHGKFGITGELYNATRLNSETRGYTGTLWAVTYAQNPRLEFDAGVDLGLTAGVAHQRAYFGVSYAIGELYPSLRPPKHRTPES